MTLFYRLRRSVALFVCPEIGVEARLKAARVERERVGFFDLEGAKVAARERAEKRASKGVVNVEVQSEPDGPWRPARFIDGRLHWTSSPLRKAEVAYLASIRDECVRTNREVPVAIAAALALADQQSSGEETRPACQEPRDSGLNDAEAKLRFRFPQSVQQGAS